MLSLSYLGCILDEGRLYILTPVDIILAEVSTHGIRAMFEFSNN